MMFLSNCTLPRCGSPEDECKYNHEHDYAWKPTSKGSVTRFEEIRAKNLLMARENGYVKSFTLLYSVEHCIVVETRWLATNT